MTVRIHRVRDLSAEERGLVERLLGREVADNESLDICAYRTHDAPAGAARREAMEDLAAAVRDLSERCQAAPGDELQREIDLAVEEVRRDS